MITLKNKYENLILKTLSDEVSLIDTLVQTIKNTDSAPVAVKLYAKAEMIRYALSSLLMDYKFEIGSVDLISSDENDYQRDYSLCLDQNETVSIERLHPASVPEPSPRGAPPLKNIFLYEEDCSPQLLGYALCSDTEAVTLCSFDAG